jgi:hypothetical protein
VLKGDDYEKDVVESIEQIALKGKVLIEQANNSHKFQTREMWKKSQKGWLSHHVA